MAGDSVGGEGSEGNCPPPWVAKGLTDGGIVDGGTGGWAKQWDGSTQPSSKAATGIHAQANRSMTSNLATFHGGRHDDGSGRTGLANLSVYRLHMMVMIINGSKHG